MSGIIPSVLQDWQSKREMLQALRDAYRDKTNWVVARAQFKNLGSEEGVALCDDTLKMFDEFIAETERVLEKTGGGGLIRHATTTNEVIRKRLQDLMFDSYPRLQNRMTPVPEIVTYTRLRELAKCGWYALEDYWEADYQEMITPEPSFSAVCNEVADHLYTIAKLLDAWKGIPDEEANSSPQTCHQPDRNVLKDVR